MIEHLTTVLTDHSNVPGNASASVPAVRNAGEECPQIDAYFDNVDYVNGDDPDFDPDIKMGDELPVKGRW